MELIMELNRIIKIAQNLAFKEFTFRGEDLVWLKKIEYIKRQEKLLS